MTPAARRADYRMRRRAGLCVRGCKRDAAPGIVLCRRCRRYRRMADARYYQHVTKKGA